MKGSTRKVFNGDITLMYTYKNLLFRNYTNISNTISDNSKYGSFDTWVSQQPYNKPYDEKGHLIAQSACLGSELDNLILEYVETEDESIKKRIDKFIKWCIKVFGKEFSNVIRLNNVGTDESPKFDQKEVNSIKKAIQILPGKSNQIQKAVYEYHSQFEDELFGEYDYDDNKGFSPSVNQMKTVQGCANYFDQIKLDLYLLYDNKPVVYLDMYNTDYFKFNSEGGIVCTILPKIVVDDWEGYPFEEAEE